MDNDTLERKIRSALEVPVPPDLGRRILGRTRRPRSALLASTGAVVLAAAGAITLWGLPEAGQPAHRLAAHVAHEPQALEADREVAPARLGGLLARAGLPRDLDLGRTVYARWCPIGGSGDGLHAVVAEPEGPVTLLFLPETALAPARWSTAGDHARLLRARGGTAALFAASREALERIAQRLRPGVH